MSAYSYSSDNKEGLFLKHIRACPPYLSAPRSNPDFDASSIPFLNP